MKYIVKKIMEPDYGCEERPDNYIAMDRVLLRNENGMEIELEIADNELYEKDINEGDWVYFDTPEECVLEIKNVVGMKK